ncbi:hypothetical protein [Tomitella gaofuii]|nr:hypothetical protein [Tomitella gaofuii]
MGSVNDVFGNLTETMQGLIDAGLGAFQGFFDVISDSLGTGGGTGA